jgi:hypothetical protein
MARNRSLVIVNATRANSGHYFCVGVNTAGAAMERSHVLVYDEADFVRGRKSNSSSEDEYYHVVPDTDLAAARAALLERTVTISGLYADSPTSLRISWRLEVAPGSPQQQYLEGYYIHYRETTSSSGNNGGAVAGGNSKTANGRPTAAMLASVKVLHAGATSYSLNRLCVHTEYEVFIAPFYKTVLGLPSASRLARTAEDWPSSAPQLTNMSTSGQYLALSWRPLQADAANGVLAGYRIRLTISGGDIGEPAATTLVVNPAETAARIDLTSLQLPPMAVASSPVSINAEVAALNSVGQGPFSQAASLQLDLAGLLSLQRVDSAGSSSGDVAINGGDDDHTQGVALDASTGWVGALIGSAALVVILIGGSVLVYRRQQQQRAAKGGPANSNGHHHHHHSHLEYLEKKKFPTVREQPTAEEGKQQLPNSASLWIDRRWTAEDCPTGGNSLDRRLLSSGGGTGGPYCTAAENEYTYIDRNKLATFAGRFRGGGTDNGGGGRDHLDLAPYASTDILRDEAIGGSAYYSTRYLVSCYYYRSSTICTVCTVY